MLSSLSLPADLQGCSRCGGVRTVGLREFRDRIRGRPYRTLLSFHLRAHDREQMVAALGASLASLPDDLRSLAEEIPRRWGEEQVEPRIWETDAAEVLERVAREAASHRGEEDPPRADALFDLFEAVTLRLALLASEDSALRSAMELRESTFVRRHGWRVVAVGALGYGVLTLHRPLWDFLLWTGMGLVLLPPVARAVAASLESDASAE